MRILQDYTHQGSPVGSGRVELPVIPYKSIPQNRRGHSPLILTQHRLLVYSPGQRWGIFYECIIVTMGFHAIGTLSYTKGKRQT